MNHDVTPESSGTSAVALAESPPPETLPLPTEPYPDAGDPGEPGMPGPISWDLPEGGFEALGEAPGSQAPDPLAAPARAAATAVEEREADLPGEEDSVSGEIAPPAAVWSLGPVGRRRHLGLLTLLSIGTAGLYSVAWFARANREMREFDPRMQVRPGRTALAIVLPVLASWVLAAAAGARLLADHFGARVDLPVSVMVTTWFLAAPVVAPWLVLLFPFSIVASAMTVERLRVIEDRAGAAPDLQARPVASLRWLLIPAVGLVVLGVWVQARLNRVWAAALP